MCGLIYVKRTDGKPARKVVMKQYRRQKLRGQSGFGYVAVRDDKVVAYHRAQFEHEIMKALREETAPEILFHHRYPTHGPNVDELAHPLQVSDPQLDHQYLIAHNGVIRNHAALRTAHKNQGFTYRTDIEKQYRVGDKTYTHSVEWNDSESLAIETALALDGKKSTIDTEGAAAVIGYQLDGEQVINRFFYRNYANPLKLYQDGIMTVLSSEGRGDEVSPTVVKMLAQTGITELDIVSPQVYQPTAYTHSYSDGSSGYRGTGMRSTKQLLSQNMSSWQASLDGMVGAYDEDTLWREYNWVGTEIARVHEQIGALDAKATQEVTADDVELRGTLQSKLDGLRFYEEDLESEVHGREAFTTKGITF